MASEKKVKLQLLKNSIGMFNVIGNPGDKVTVPEAIAKQMVEKEFAVIAKGKAATPPPPPTPPK